MRYFLTLEEIRMVESHALLNGLSLESLIEKAGLLLSQRIFKIFRRRSFPHVGVVVGPGHNGADGLVVARELFLKGFKVKILEIDASKQVSVTKKLGQYCRSIGIPFVDKFSDMANSNFFVDAIFGVGLTRPAELKIIDEINEAKRPIVSIDLPSGINADVGIVGKCIRAQFTLSLQSFKMSFCNDDVIEALGSLDALDLGLTPFLKIHPPIEVNNFPVIKFKSLTTNKYLSGKVSVVAGSQKYLGASILCARALRESGVGYITFVMPRVLQLELLKIAPDVVCQVEADFTKDDCVLIGPGIDIGRPELLELVAKVPCPLVLDGSALDFDILPLLQKRNSPTILTPHGGEFKKMFSHLTTLPKIEAAKQAALEANAIIVFKGPKTVIACPNGDVSVQMESTPSLARAGTGDVLAGMICGLVAQQPAKNWEAVKNAVSWHSWTARFIEDRLGQNSVSSISLIENLNLLLNFWNKKKLRQNVSSFFKNTVN